MNSIKLTASLLYGLLLLEKVQICGQLFQSWHYSTVPGTPLAFSLSIIVGAGVSLSWRVGLWR